MDTFELRLARVETKGVINDQNSARTLGGKRDEDGKLDGWGEKVYYDGHGKCKNIAVGHWVHGKRHGTCKKYKPDGSIRSAEWAEGKRIGKSVLVRPYASTPCIMHHASWIFCVHPSPNPPCVMHHASWIFFASAPPATHPAPCTAPQEGRGAALGWRS